MRFAPAYLHNKRWQTPNGAEEPVAVQLAGAIHSPVHCIQGVDVTRMRIWVLPVGRLSHETPRVAADKRHVSITAAQYTVAGVELLENMSICPFLHLGLS